MTGTPPLSTRTRREVDQEAVPWWIRQAGRVQGLRPAVVPSVELDACRRLLFRVFHQELEWEPPAGNPSGLRVEGETGRMLDVYDDEAVWLGVYRGSTLVACCRVILPDAGRPLEVARYTDIPAEILDGALEVNRLAVLPGHRGGGTFAVIVLMLWWMTREHGVTRALITAEEPLSRRLYRPLGWEFTGVRFFYHASDPHECELLSMNPRGAHVVRSVGKAMVRAVARRVRV